MLKKHVKELLTHAVTSSTFKFNDVYYKQVDRVAMGSPLGPALANFFQYITKVNGLRIVHNNLNQFYRRYVDDIFLMFKKRDRVKNFLDTLILAIVIFNSPVKKKKTTKYRFQTFPSAEIITHWKNLSSVNLHLVESTLILIVS